MRIDKRDACIARPEQATHQTEGAAARFRRFGAEALDRIDQRGALQMVTAGILSWRCHSLQMSFDSSLDLKDVRHISLPSSHALPAVLRPHPPLQAFVAGGLLGYSFVGSIYAPRRPRRRSIGPALRADHLLHRLVLPVFMGIQYLISQSMIKHCNPAFAMPEQLNRKEIFVVPLIAQVKADGSGGARWQQATSAEASVAHQILCIDHALFGRLLLEVLFIIEVSIAVALPLWGVLPGRLRQGHRACRRLWRNMFADLSASQRQKPLTSPVVPIVSEASAGTLPRRPPANTLPAAPAPLAKMDEFVDLLCALARHKEAATGRKGKDSPEIEKAREWLRRYSIPSDDPKTGLAALQADPSPTTLDRIVTAITTLRQRAEALPNRLLSQVLSQHEVKTLLNDVESEARERLRAIKEAEEGDA